MFAGCIRGATVRPPTKKSRCLARRASWDAKRSKGEGDMSSQLRVSHALLALGVGLGLMSGAALAQDKAAAKVQLPQQVLPTGAEDAVAAPAPAARSLARAVTPS